MMQSNRSIALDVFRGITIAAMITVNNPGSWSHIYPPLRHSEWHGCTPTDLVFPFFLFIVGVSMFFSFSRHESGLNPSTFLRILKRSVIIFLVGIFLSSFPQWQADWAKLRIPGVLQRIALAYFIGALLVLSLKKNILPWLSAAVLLIYWAVLWYFGADDPYSLKGNIIPAVDKFVLGDAHLYHGFGITFDPEGLLSTLPAVITVILGYLAGNIIAGNETNKGLRLIAMYGASAIGMGLAWSLLFPLNKPLWTSSYVIYTAGWAAVILAFLIWLIEIKGIRRWTSFFVVFGMNSLFIFAFAGIWARVLLRIIKTGEGENTVNGYNWLYQNIFQPLAGDVNGSLLFALAHIAVFWFICWILYRRKIFIKV